MRFEEIIKMPHQGSEFSILRAVLATQGIGFMHLTEAGNEALCHQAGQSYCG
jgi:hypothetical protein